MGQPYNHGGWPKDGPNGTTTVQHGCEALQDRMDPCPCYGCNGSDGPNDTMLDGGCKT